MLRETGNWVRYRERFNLTRADEVDLHFGVRDPGVEDWDAMEDVAKLVIQSLRNAQENQRPYLMFIHGSSTSGPGQTSARSVVRNVMRSKDVTPYIVRSGCIQHRTVFVAKIRQGAST